MLTYSPSFIINRESATIRDGLAGLGISKMSGTVKLRWVDIVQISKVDGTI